MSSALFARAFFGARASALALIVIPALFVAGATNVSAQAMKGSSTQRASRRELTQKLAVLEKQAGNGRANARLQQELSVLRARLDVGDFKPGDRFVLYLRQDSVRTDTLIVRDSLRVAVLNLPEFSVAGVLRSELEDRLSAHVSRFLRNASVRTTLLTRVSVTGAVKNPGFYYAVPDRPINDLLTSAGGPAAEADLNKLSVSRAGQTVLRGGDAKKVVEEGRTLELLDIQSGDTVHIPTKRKLNWQLIIQMAFITMSLLFALLQFVQWYYNRQDS